MTDSDTPVRVFTYTPGRGGKLADKLFAGIREGAVLMTDGYAPYDGIAQRHHLIHLACWTHARRGFVPAEDNVPKAARTPELLATRFIKLIGRLFAAEARSQTWKAERRQRLRRRYSARVLDVLHRLMLQHQPNVVPGSLLGKALNYLRGQWTKLVRYIENGNWPISNNPCHAASGMNPVMPTNRGVGITPVKTPSGHSAWAAVAGCSQILSAARTPVRTCTRWSRPAAPTASIPTVTFTGSSKNFLVQRPSRTTTRCCRGRCPPNSAEPSPPRPRGRRNYSERREIKTAYVESRDPGQTDEEREQRQP